MEDEKEVQNCVEETAPREKVIVLRFNENDEFIRADGDFGKYWGWHVLQISRTIREML